jgi:hypothetical protein
MVFVVSAIIFFALPATTAATPTLTATTNQLGPTPEILGYNSGHFYPGSNTRDWWRYSGVNGARFFIPSREFEPFTTLQNLAVTNRSSFLAQRDALRADPVTSPFIDWPAFTNRFEHDPIGGIVFGYALRQVRDLHLQICAQITANPSSFPIADTNDWSGLWKFWLHCYAQAFYLAREFDVQRFQYFNEPNHPNAGGLTFSNYFHRLQLASDAFQSAVADVNRLHGKSLTPLVLAPVSAGSPDGLYPKWGRPLIENRHVNFLGQTNTNFSLLHKYDYHQYNSTPERFGLTASNLNYLIAKDTSPQPSLPLTLTEFNVHTAGKFIKMTEDLDSPTMFPQLAAKTISLINNSANELYLFKLSQTDWHLGVKKNGTHYVDNTNAPYNIGAITRAGEVWRLINKGFTAHRIRLASQKSSDANNLDTMACFDPTTRRYYILFVNQTNRTAKFKIDITAWNIPTKNHVLIEEVSETCFGGVRSWKPISNHLVSETQPPYSVWLLTLSAKPESTVETVPVSDFASVRDGKHQRSSYKPDSSLRVQNNSTNADYRAVTYLKFHHPSTNTAAIQSAFLDLTTHTVNNAPQAFAHIYAITEYDDHAQTPFSHSALRTPHSEFISWSSAPSLAQGIPPGINYTNNFLLGAGNSTQLIGQLVATRRPYEKLIDITDYLRHTTNSDITFLLVRPIGFLGDNADTSALAISANPGHSPALPSLKIVRYKQD